MAGHIWRRFLQAVLNLLVIVTIVFLMARATGDLANTLVPEGASPEAVEAFRRQVGLGDPLYVQYVNFLSDLARGNLGISIKQQRPVTTIFKERMPATFSLALVALLFALVFAVPLGVISAVYRDTLIDKFAKVMAFTGQSIPPFWLGLMLIILFAVILNLLPAAGRGGVSSYVLPGLTLGWAISAGIVRLTRSSMLDVLDSDYITMARAKGLSEILVNGKHALRNALIPVITFLGLVFGAFMNGSVVVEEVFAWPGIGRMAVSAVVGRDYPVVQGAVIIFGAFFIAINFIVDILYVLVDPRIRYARH